MSSYTIVITSDVTQDGDMIADNSQLTIRVDVTPPEPRVTAIAINSTSQSGLTSLNVPRINIAAIVTALAARFPPQSLAPVRAAVLPATTEQHPAEQTPSAPVDKGAAELVTQFDTVPEPPRTGHTAATRAYRKMPDTSELRDSYQRLGTVTAVARHYGVPRHTAQGWIGRLRKLESPPEAGSTDNN